MPLRPPIALAGVVSVLAACLVAGCGATQQQAVQAKLTQFVHAVAARDSRTLCDEVLAPSLVGRLKALGLGCEQAMGVFTRGVQDPTLSIAKVTVRGGTATAVVLSGARGQASVVEAVKLIDTHAGWRVSSLAAPR